MEESSFILDQHSDSLVRVFNYETFHMCLKSLNQVCIECGLGLRYQNYCTDIDCKNYNLIKDKIRLYVTQDQQFVPKMKEKFDIILMPRPQLKDSFLASAFAVSARGTRIYYYDFCPVEDIDKIVEKVKREASENKKKIKIFNIP